MKNLGNDEQLANFCRLIRELRQSANLTMREMADRLGIGVGSIRKLENGEFPPRLTLKTIMRVQTEFGISPYAQFTYADASVSCDTR